MDADFPAAHSMDTHWFAVDEQGQVAMFDSGEDGHAPEGAQNEDILDRVWDLYQSLAPGDRPGREGVPVDLYAALNEAAARVGLFYYDYDWSGDPINVYHRETSPARPLHIDQLPPDLRERCQQFRFGNLNFAESPLIQPLEHFACDYWYKDSRMTYLASDGKTVRPVPGQEHRFAEFVELFRREDPERAAQFRFEGPAPRGTEEGANG